MGILTRTTKLSATLVLAWGCAGTQSAKVPNPGGHKTEAISPLPPQHSVAAKPTKMDVSIGAPDSALEAELEPLKLELRAYTQRIVGHLNGPLSRGKPQSTLGNFVADAMFAQTSKLVGGGLDFCFTNLGGLRTDLPEGEITAGQIAELMPFDNTLIVFQTSGPDTLAVLKRLAQRGDPMSGVQYTAGGGDFLIRGEAFDVGRHYTLCTNDYVFGGGSNYPIPPAAAATYTGVLLRDVIVQAFEEGSSDGHGIGPVSRRPR